MNGPIINGEQYQLIILRVKARDPEGRPSEAQLGYDDTTFEVQEGTEFITAFVPAHTVAPRVGRA